MKPVRFLNEKQKAFQKLMETLCYSRQSWQVWSDFVVLSAISISNVCDQAGETHDKRERRYMDIINGYSEAERALFPKMLAIVVEALEVNPDQDFLGEMFMALELGNHYRGQFFTPYCICECMAKMEINEKSKKELSKPFVTVFDCACGAGALLIAARNALKPCNIDWSTGALFVAQDIDELAGLMCYIQLSLLGCPGYVVVGDTLCNPFTTTDKHGFFPNHENHTVWYTPMYFSEIWHWRKIASRMDACLGLPMRSKRDSITVEKQVETIELENPQPPEADTQVFEMPQNEYGQLSFF